MTVEKIKAILKGKIEALEDMIGNPIYFFNEERDIYRGARLEAFKELLKQIENEESNRTS